MSSPCIALHDPIDENAERAILLVSLYAGIFCLSRSPLQASLSLPGPQFILVTGAPILLYADYRVVRGRTFNLWGTVTAAVLFFCLLAVIGGFAPSGYYTASYPPQFKSVPYFLVMGSPLVTSGLYRCGRRRFRNRTYDRTSRRL